MRETMHKDHLAPRIFITREELALVLICGILPLTIACSVLFLRLADLEAKIQARDAQCEWCMAVIDQQGEK